MASDASTTIIARRQGRIGRLTINRPAALNAVDLKMLCAIHCALNEWRDDPAVHAVVIEGAGGKAFCAGGDIRGLRDMVNAGDEAGVRAFFAGEYAVNLAIARYPKPYLALIDGVCMGGGVGLSVHGTFRAVSDRAVLAMPEASIGFFPDVGASFILPRLRPNYGMFLALTGARVDAADAMYLGLATHYVEPSRFGTLADEIAEDGLAALALATVIPSVGELSLHESDMRCFAADSVAEIIAHLIEIDSDWARDTLAAMRAMSPSALLWSFRLMRAGASQTLEQCLAVELELSGQVSRHPDFQEGVRAMVIDKDRKPRWSPARLGDVSEHEIARLFR